MDELKKWLALRSEDDVNGLTRFLVDRLLYEKKSEDKREAERLVKTLVAMLREEKTWLGEQRAYMRDEAERIALIGQTMKRAGLRSYTDEKGRIFVAGDAC
jgi:hypothetical protein